LGCASMCICQVFFGLSTTLAIAVFWRLLMGLLSGVVGTSKSVASELVGPSPEEQSRAMNFFSSASSLGMIMGPALSGILYDPSDQYQGTWLADLPLMKEFPHLLPNLMSAIISLFSGLAIVCLVPETLPEPMSLCGIEGGGYAAVGDLEANDEVAKSSSKNQAGFSAFLGTISSLWRKNPVRKATYLYSLYSFISIFFSELFPLWLLASPAVGGFGFDAFTIGMTISGSAILQLFFQFFVFRYISGVLLPIAFAKLISLLSALFYLQLPFMVYFKLGQHRVAALVVLTAQRGLQNILNMLLFTQSNVMVNNSCLREERGTVNGLVMGLGSLFKAAGPVCAGSIFAFSVSNGESLPPVNFWLSFLVLSTLCVMLAAFIVRYMPLELNAATELKIEKRAQDT